MTDSVNWVLEMSALAQLAFTASMSATVFVLWYFRKDTPTEMRWHIALVAASYNILIMYPLLHLAGYMPHDATKQGVEHFGYSAFAGIVLAAMFGNVGLVIAFKRQIDKWFPHLCKSSINNT